MFVPYVELHCHSAYSFLDGASHPVELAGTAAEQGHAALALTDHDGLHGAMEMAQALKPLGVRPITGAELTLDDGTHLTLLCESREGYTNLCRLLTASHWHTRRWAREGWTEARPASGPARRRAAHLARRPRAASRRARVPVRLRARRRRGLARRGRAPRRGRGGGAAGSCAIFGPERLRIELQRPFWRHDRRRNRLLAELAERLGVPSVATGNVHVHARERISLQDAMVAVRLGATLDETEPQPARQLLARARTARADGRALPRAPGRGRGERAAGRAPDASTSPRTSATATPARRTRTPTASSPSSAASRFGERYRAGARSAAARLEEELRVIRHLGLSGFFLLHRDLLELAREVAAEVRGPESARRAAAARAAGAARACRRSSATSPASRTSTRSRTSCCSAASSTRS